MPKLLIEKNFEINSRFTCRIKKEPSIHVTWYYNGIEVSSGHMMDVVDGDVVSSLSIPHPKTANQGEYSCYVRNLYGETKTSTYLEIEGSVNYVNHVSMCKKLFQSFHMVVKFIF